MISNVRVALGLVIAALATTPATADPVTISVIGAGGVTFFSSSWSQEPQAAPVIFTVSLTQIWTGLDPIALRFSNVTPGSYLDITTEATNETEVTWTSWGSRTAAMEPGALPPVHATFFASHEGFFTMNAYWRGVPEAVFARCSEVYFSHECGPTNGNVFTAYNGTVAPGETLSIRYLLHVDHGDFSLTQSPNAPVPEPATLGLLVLGLVGVAGREVRRHRSAART